MKFNKEYNTPGHYAKQCQRRAMAFGESPEGMRREGPRLASFEYAIQTTAGQVHIRVWLLSYGQNLAYAIVRGQVCQISRM